mgnify:CR=1 FL=1
MLFRSVERRAISRPDEVDIDRPALSPLSEPEVGIEEVDVRRVLPLEERDSASNVRYLASASAYGDFEVDKRRRFVRVAKVGVVREDDGDGEVGRGGLGDGEGGKHDAKTSHCRRTKLFGDMEDASGGFEGGGKGEVEMAIRLECVGAMGCGTSSQDKLDARNVQRHTYLKRNFSERPAEQPKHRADEHEDGED